MAENIGVPYVSVIMPVYNGGHYLQDAINSILSQTFSNFEFIIIDDASTDNTIDIINAYKDDRIKLFVKQKNTGIVDSLNIGVEAARGKYIARMDADDISYKDRLQKQLNYIEEHPDVLVLGSRYKIKDTNRISAGIPLGFDHVKLYTLTECPLAHPTAFINREVFSRYCLKYNKEAVHAEDYDLWSRIIEIGKIENLDEVLLEYRKHDKQVSVVEKVKQNDTCNSIRLRQLKNLIDFSNKGYSENFVIRVIQQEAFGVTSDDMALVSMLIGDLWSANELKKIYSKELFIEFLHNIWAYYLTQLSGYRFKNYGQIMSDPHSIKKNKSGFALKYLLGSVWGLRRKLI